MHLIVSVLLVAVCLYSVESRGTALRAQSTDDAVETEDGNTTLCPVEAFEGVRAVKGFGKWDAQTLGKVGAGFSILISQHKTTVSARCFSTYMKEENGVVNFTHVFPTGEPSTFEYDVSGGDSQAADQTKNIMIAGASEHFLVYTMCNNQTGHLNLVVSYNKEITTEEKKAVNDWIKQTSFPLIGRWGSVNFDTCYFTKTYLCDGGHDSFCSTIKKRHSRKDDSSSEEDEEGYILLF